MKKSGKNSSTSPNKLVLSLGVIIVVLAFVGAFGYSFVKSRINHQVLTGIAALQNLVGGKSAAGNPLEAWQKMGGQVPGLPPGSTVQSKEEGLATCQLNGSTECYALIAVSFNDLSLCQKAPDKKACETGAVELKKSFEDSFAENGNGGGGANPEEGTGGEGEDTSSEPDNQELRECKTGTFYQSVQGKVTVTGKERITLGGIGYETCCWEATGYETTDDVTGMKVCMVIDQPEDSSIVFQKTDGRYLPIGAQVKKNDRQCTYAFNEAGVEEQEYCE